MLYNKLIFFIVVASLNNTVLRAMESESGIENVQNTAVFPLKLKNLTYKDLPHNYKISFEEIAPVPRPTNKLSTSGLNSFILQQLTTWNTDELEKKDFLLFHGTPFTSFNIEKFKALYGSFIECDNGISKKQMLFLGLWKNLCMSASLIHPTKSPTISKFGLILKVPPQLIYLADYRDVPRTTHELAVMFLKDPHSNIENVLCGGNREKLLSSDNCFAQTSTTWRNEIQFVPEAVVDGVHYSIKVGGLWARDILDESIISDSERQNLSSAILEQSYVCSPLEISKFKKMSEDLDIPLILWSKWKNRD